MNDVRKMGRVTIPTDTDAVSETLEESDLRLRQVDMMW